MTLWQEYLQPKTVTEAISALINAPGSALPLAGGTDLILDLDQGRHPLVHTIVDITSVREMLPIEIRGDELFVGGAASHTHIIEFRIGCKKCGSTYRSMWTNWRATSPQHRALGGNVAHALPAADGTIALMALNAEVEVAHQKGIRRVPSLKCFLALARAR